VEEGDQVDVTFLVPIFSRVKGADVDPMPDEVPVHSRPIGDLIPSNRILPGADKGSDLQVAW
jgi:hypothetical protein